MSTERIAVVSRELCLRLRSIDEGDLEFLRELKNRNAHRFFYKKAISPVEQENWYAGFRDRPDDHMFIVEATCRGRPESFGCIGFRLIDGEVDVYNVIRDRRLEGQRCGMRDATSLLCSYAAEFSDTVSLSVLSDNPAVEWYEKLLFRKVEERSDHYLMKLDSDAFVPVSYSIEELP